MKRFVSLGIGLVLAIAFTGASADYPTRPITFLTMVQPGAQIDRLHFVQRAVGLALAARRAHGVVDKCLICHGSAPQVDGGKDPELCAAQAR